MRKPKNDTSYIYTLTDPRDDGVCYVGVSVKPSKRLTAIKRGSHCGRDVARWAVELACGGLEPQLDIVETVPTVDRHTRELSWIQRMLKQGHDLLNHDGVERKFGLANRWNDADK